MSDMGIETVFSTQIHVEYEYYGKRSLEVLEVN